MKKITAILKDCKLVDRLLGIRERQIYNAIARAKDNTEEVMAEAQIKYEESMRLLGDKDADYKSIINTMLEQKTTLLNAESTLEYLDEIKKDLDTTAEIEEEVAKNAKNK